MPSGNLDCAKNKWVEIQLVDEFGDGRPYSNLSFEITYADKTSKKHKLDKNGFIRLENIPCGKVSVIFKEQFSEASYPSDRKLTDNELISWYNYLNTKKHNMTNLQVSAEQTTSSGKLTYSPSNFEKTHIPTEYHNIEVIDLVENKLNLIRNTDWITGKSYSTIVNEIIENKPKDNQNTKSKSAYEKYFDKDKAEKDLEKVREEANRSPKQKQDGITRPPTNAEMKENIRKSSPQYTLSKSNNTTNGFLTGKKHVLRIRALRAYRPLLSMSDELNALNLYQLAILADLSYRDFDTPPKKSISSLFSLWASNRPENYNGHEVLLENVPYSKRYQITNKQVNFICNEKSDTEGFLTHHDKILLISLRGTWPTINEDTTNLKDIYTDLNVPQTDFKEHQGSKVHKGFYSAFISVKTTIDEYLKLYADRVDKIIITGHSLGGALATIVATWLQKTKDYAKGKIILYTYGSPRVGDRNFVNLTTKLSGNNTIKTDFPHHRIVNNLDPVPYIPFPWLKDESRTHPFTFAGNPLAHLDKPNLPYTHHGQLHHIIPLPTTSNNSFLSGVYYTDTLQSAELNDYEGLPQSRPDIIFSNPSDHSMNNYIEGTLNIFKRWRVSYLNDKLLVTENELQLMQSDINSKKNKIMDKIEENKEEILRNPLNSINPTNSIKTSKLRVDYNEAIANKTRVESYNEVSTGQKLYGTDIFAQFGLGKGPLPLQEIVNRWAKIK